MPLLPPTGLTVTPTSAPPWARGFGGTTFDYGAAVAIDASGNIVMAGVFFSSSIDLGTGSLANAGGSDIFIAKFTPDGNTCLWSERLGGTGNDVVAVLALDGNGDIFIGGSFVGTTDLGDGPVTNAGASDMLLAKFDSDGVFQWAKTFGSTGNDSLNSLAVDSDDNVVITGQFSGSVSFGGDTLSGGQTFIAKFSGVDGAHLWSKNFGCLSNSQGRGVAIDANDDIVIVGQFDGPIDFTTSIISLFDPAPTALRPVNNELGSPTVDFFVAKFSTAGAHLWSKSFGGQRGDTAKNVALDASGNIFVSGTFTWTITLGSQTLATNGSSDSDIFLAKFSAAGVPIWAKSFPGASTESVSGMAVDATGNVIITGSFSYTLNMRDTVLSSAVQGLPDVFVAKYSTSGSLVWAKRFGGSEGDQSNGTAVDASGAVIITGSFSGTVNFDGQSLTSAGASDIFLCRVCHLENSITWTPPSDQLLGTVIPIATYPDASIEGFYPVELISGKMYKYVGGANEVDFEYNGVTIDGGETIEFIADGAAVKIYYTPLAAVTATIREHGDQTYRLYRNRDIIREIPASALSANLPVLDTLLTELTFYTYRVDAIDTGGGIASSPLAAAIMPECTPTGYPIQFGGLTGDRPNAATIDASGNVYVCGGLPGMLSPMLFVAKLNSSAAFVWVKYYPSSGSSMITSIAVDASGNVYIAGHFNGSLNLGDGPIQGNSYGFASFMAKLNSSGVLQFKVAKVDEQGSNSRIAVSSGNIIVASTYVDLGGYYGTRGKVDKYNSSGVLQWSTILGVEDNSATNFACNGLAVDSSGDIHLVGRKTEGVKTICGQTMDSGPATNTLLTKLNGSDGSCVWVRNHGLSELRGSTTGLAIALDSQGNHLVAGFYTINGSAGGERFPEAINFPSPFIAKYDSSGNHIWSQGIKTLRFAAPSRILVGDNDAAFVIGTADPGRFVFPSHDVAVLVPSGYVMKFSSAGVFSSLNFYGNDLADGAIAPSSKIMLAGSMETPTKGLDNFIELLTQ